MFNLDAPDGNFADLLDAPGEVLNTTPWKTSRRKQNSTEAADLRVARSGSS